MLSITIEELLDFLRKLTDILKPTLDEKLIQDVLKKNITSDDLPEIISMVDDMLRKWTSPRLSPEEIIELIDTNRSDIIRKEAVITINAMRLLKEWRKF